MLVGAPDGARAAKAAARSNSARVSDRDGRRNRARRRATAATNEKARFAQSGRDGRFASPPPARRPGHQAVELELKWRAVADQRRGAARTARARPPSAAGDLDELADQKQRSSSTACASKASCVLDDELRSERRPSFGERHRGQRVGGAKTPRSRTTRATRCSRRRRGQRAVRDREVRARHPVGDRPVTAKLRDAAKPAKRRAATPTRARRACATTRNSAAGPRAEAKAAIRIP